MTSNAIPAVPQFLLQNADRHRVQAFAADLPDADQDKDIKGETASPLIDLSQFDLLAQTQAEDPAGCAECPSPSADAVNSPAPPLAPSPASREAGSGYSATDLALFRALTGYNLDIRASMPRAMDDSGNRASVMDRLFTTLAEEAFKFADRQRRTGTSPESDLTVEDLAGTLAPIRRAAAAIGARGLSAFETLEAAVGRLRATVLAGTILSDGEGVAA